jgi:hypothetical protein
MQSYQMLLKLLSLSKLIKKHKKSSIKIKSRYLINNGTFVFIPEYYIKVLFTKVGKCFFVFNFKQRFVNQFYHIFYIITMNHFNCCMHITKRQRD